MSGRSLILAVKIIGDASDAIRAMDEASGASNKFADGLNTAAKWSAVGLAAIGGATKECVEAASELQQASGAMASVFGDNTKKMTEYAQQAADAVGLSEAQYSQMASVLGSQMKNMGIEGEALGTQTNDLIGLGADMAAMFGGTTSDAVSALSSLLRGERDPIERYGVSIKQADIDAQKAAMGLNGLTGEAAKNADLQATLALLTKQTADAQGTFAAETDTAAGSAQIAAANFENAKAALGEALLPIVTAASEKLAELARWFQENAEWITPLVAVLAALAAAIIVINAAYKAYVAVQAMQTAAQWAQNAAWLANPITWIVLAIIAAIAILVTIIVLVVKHWDEIKAAGVAAFEAVIGWIKNAISWIGEKLSAPILAVIQWFNNLKLGAVIVFQTIIQWVKDAIAWLGKMAKNILPGWAQNLLGLNARMTVTPELAPMVAPAFAARMAITPEAYSAPMPTPAESYAPLAPQTFAAMGMLLGALVAPTPRPQASQTVYNDNRKYELTLPNYMGDRDEVIAELRDGLDDLERKEQRFQSA